MGVAIESEVRGVAAQVRTDGLIRGIDGGSRWVRAVAERGQDARGVGVHRRPDAAGAAIAGPLAAERARALEDEGLEPFVLEILSRGQARGTTADDRDPHHRRIVERTARERP